MPEVDSSNVDAATRTTTLDNGLRIVTEAMSSVRSASIGCWVGVGNRDETPDLAGASHFLEHLLFKGSPTRSAQEIAEQIDRTGGDLNAYTSKEHTAYQARVPDTRVDLAVDILCDVLANPGFTDDDVDGERLVILEELAQSEDLPDDLVHTALQESLFPEHSLGWEVLGTSATIEAMRADAIREFHRQWYQPANLVFAAAGNVDHDHLVERISTAFSSSDGGETPDRLAPGEGVRDDVQLERPTEQVHIAMGWRGVSYDDPDRYALAIANQVIGGGLSSRLFQEVREKRGLAYSVYSSMAAFTDAGTLTLYAGTAAERVDELLEVINTEIDDLVQNGLTPLELAVARDGFEGATLLGLEDSGSRMARIGTATSVRGYVPTIDSFVESIRAVTADDVDRVVARVLGGSRSRSAVGNVAALA